MADTNMFVFIVVFSFLFISGVTSSGVCYQFTGNGSVVFGGNFNIAPSARFKLKFKTSASAGILYYAEGLYHRERVFDYEGLFLQDGYVHYFLFNPAPYSIGSTFGFHGKSSRRLNDGNWHEVEFYRNILTEVISRGGDRTMEYQTGLKVDGRTAAMDNGRREGVDLQPRITLGEDPHLADRSNKEIGGFKGKISDFQELTTNYPFTVESNRTGGVTHCITGPDPV